MSVYFEEEGDISLDIEVLSLTQQVIEQALDYEQCPYESEVEVLLTTDEAVRELNRDYRQIDQSTDVLSFPMIEFSTPAKYDDLEAEAGCFHPDTGELLLGNIVISKEKVIAQAELYGHSQKREYAFLIAHSVLHLLGYDHLSEEERILMEDHQETILGQLHILR